MTGEKLRRVQSIRKWLEKAEKSFTSDKEISGELNLIMAQAEMQRLKETDKTGERRKVWGIRVLAMAAAVLVVSGAAVLRETEAPASAAPVTTVSVPVSAEVKTKPAETVAPAVSAEIPKAEARAAEPAEIRAAEPVPAVAEVRAQPVLSESEIQSVVGEAGRALRGQS